MLTFKEYTRAIDIWSVGCVLAEMLSGKPLFPGRDCKCIPWSREWKMPIDSSATIDHDQLSIILDILGTPSIDDFYAITSQRSREYIRALPFRKKRPFGTLFPNASPLAIDFLEQCLTFSPKRRIEVGEALKHPYLAVSSNILLLFYCVLVWWICGAWCIALVKWKVKRIWICIQLRVHLTSNRFSCCPYFLRRD